MVKLFRRLATNRKGATAVEYGLILAMIVLTMVGALTGLADQTSSMWNNISYKTTHAS